MATYERFEDLPVWKDAVDLAVAADVLVRMSALARDRDYASQLRRAALSVSNNIAEGFERGTTEELLTFLYIARGSAGEVRSMMHVFDRLPTFASSDLKSQISNLKSSAESIARQLRGWAESLQNSPITGQRRLNDNTRKAYQYRKDVEEMDRELRAAQARIFEKLDAERHARLQSAAPPVSIPTPHPNSNLKSQI